MILFKKEKTRRGSTVVYLPRKGKEDNWLASRLSFSSYDNHGYRFATVGPFQFTRSLYERKNYTDNSLGKRLEIRFNVFGFRLELTIGPCLWRDPTSEIKMPFFYIKTDRGWKKGKDPWYGKYCWVRWRLGHFWGKWRNFLFWTFHYWRPGFYFTIEYKTMI